MVLLEQISALIDFLEGQPELAQGQCSRTHEGRSLANQLWAECAQILNYIAADCPNKSPAGWRTFYNEYKSKIIKKIKIHKREMSTTGGVAGKKVKLTPLQNRVCNILGLDLGDPLPGVRYSSFPPSCNQPTSNQPTSNHPTNHQPTSNHPTNHQPTSNQPTNHQLTNHQPPSHKLPSHKLPSHQPPRRFQKSMRRYPAEEKDHSALEAAQARLERIENKNAEATLEHAQAISNLAATIESLGATTSQATNRLAEALERIAESLILFAPSASKNEPESD